MVPVLVVLERLGLAYGCLAEPVGRGTPADLTADELIEAEVGGLAELLDCDCDGSDNAKAFNHD